MLSPQSVNVGVLLDDEQLLVFLLLVIDTAKLIFSSNLKREACVVSQMLYCKNWINQNANHPWEGSRIGPAQKFLDSCCGEIACTRRC